MIVPRDTDIESALSSRQHQRSLIEGRTPRVSEFLLNSYRFGGGGGDGGTPSAYDFDFTNDSDTAPSLDAVNFDFPS